MANITLRDFARKFKEQALGAANITRQVARPIVAPINRLLARPVKPTPTVQFLSGLERGVRAGGAGFTGAERYLPQTLQPKLPQFRTKAGGAGELAGGIAGFATGPGRLTAPLEAVTALRFGRFLPQGGGLIPRVARAAIPALAAETATSVPLGVTEARIKGKPTIETVGEQLKYGLAGRGLFGATGRIVGPQPKPVARFTLDEFSFKELVDAEEMIRNPRGFLSQMNLGKHATLKGYNVAEKSALKTIQKNARETIDRIAAKYLPDKQYLRLKTPEAQIRALVDLSQQNRLANVPGMGFIEQPPVGMKERGFIKTVRETETTAKPVAEQVKGFYKPITNKETIQQAQFTIDTQGWDVAKRQAISGQQTAENTAIGLELMRRAQDSQQYDEAIDIAQKMAAKGTTAGQAIQAFSIWGRMTPEGMLRYAAKEVDKATQEAGLADKLARKLFGIKTPKLTSDDAAQITDLMKKANATESEEVKAQYVKQALEVINDKIPYGVSELIDMFRYNNLLSNPLTHLRNFTSNALQTFLTRPLTKAVSGDVKGAYKYYGGLYKGWDEAVSDASKAFKGQIPLEKPDIQGLRQAKAPRILTVPTRMMEASDKFFQGLIRNAEIAGGKTADEASQIAKYSLFRTMLDPTGEKTGQGYLLRGIDKATQGFTQFGKKFPAVRWFVPFIQTSMNIVKQWLEYSPAGVLTIPGARDRSEQVAKTLIGSTVTMLTAKLAFDGRTTWSPPVDSEEKELFYASGKKPFAIRIGNNWVPMQTFGIFGFPIALAAAAKNYQEDSRTALTDSQMEKLSKTLLSQVEFFSGQTFMEGLGNMVSLVKGDKEYSLPGNIAFTSTQLIPFTGLASYVSRLIDPVYRKVEGQTIGERFTQTIKRGIPFASKTLEPFEKPGGELETRNITDYIAPYAMGIQEPRYQPALETRTTRLQENAVLNKKLRKFDDLESRVKELIQLGNTQRASELIRLNKEEFQNGLLLKKARSDIKNWQDMREQAATDTRLSDEQRARVLKRIDEEIKKRLNILEKI